MDIRHRIPLCSFGRYDQTSTLQAHPVSNKKNAQEIPTPQYDDVDTYERDYTRTFAQPATYIRGRGGLFCAIAIAKINNMFSSVAVLLSLTTVCALQPELKLVILLSMTWTMKMRTGLKFITMNI